MTSKDRQRWQPEEDAILNAYVARYGSDDWNLISERMGDTLDRDPKSCHERWKNYLKPGIKRGPLTDQEQELVIRLQTKYGNKWKRIAAEVPGRTAKRLGKWWEVYKERKLKEKRKFLASGNADSSPGMITEGIQIQIPAPVPTFSSHFFTNITLNGETAFSTTAPSERGICKLSVPDLSTSTSDNPSGNSLSTSTGWSEGGVCMDLIGLTVDEEPLLTLGRSTKRQGVQEVHSEVEVVATSGTKMLAKDTEARNAEDSGLSLSSPRTPGERGYVNLDPPTTESTSNNEAISFGDSMNLSLIDLMKDVKENHENWMVQKTRIRSKLRELKKQLELEKLAKKRQKMEETEAKVRALKVEERLYLDKLDEDYAELVSSLDKDAEVKENKLMESWTMKYDKLVHLFEQHTSFHGPLFQAIHSQGIHNVA